MGAMTTTLDRPAAQPVAPDQAAKLAKRASPAKPEIDVERAARLYTTRAVAADPFAESLTEAQARQFREEGWVALEGVFSADEVEIAKVALADFIQGRIAPTDGRTHVQ